MNWDLILLVITGITGTAYGVWMYFDIGRKQRAVNEEIRARATFLNYGIITPNEARESIGLPPVPPENRPVVRLSSDEVNHLRFINGAWQLPDPPVGSSAVIPVKTSPEPDPPMYPLENKRNIQL